MSDPYPKAKQLARGERRYRRKVASPKQWAAIMAEKGRYCRIAESYPHQFEHVHYHHLVPRSRGGDDVPDNLVPLCVRHHERVTNNDPLTLRLLLEGLYDEERAYMVRKLGADAPRRLFGVGA